MYFERTPRHLVLLVSGFGNSHHPRGSLRGVKRGLIGVFFELNGTKWPLNPPSHTTNGFCVSIWTCDNSFKWFQTFSTLSWGSPGSKGGNWWFTHQSIYQKAVRRTTPVSCHFNVEHTLSSRAFAGWFYIISRWFVWIFRMFDFGADIKCTGYRFWDFSLYKCIGKIRKIPIFAQINKNGTSNYLKITIHVLWANP